MPELIIPLDEEDMRLIEAAAKHDKDPIEEWCLDVLTLFASYRAPDPPWDNAQPEPTK